MQDTVSRYILECDLIRFLFFNIIPDFFLIIKQLKFFINQNIILYRKDIVRALIIKNLSRFWACTMIRVYQKSWIVETFVQAQLC